jgi:histidinol-phosphatase
VSTLNPDLALALKLADRADEISLARFQALDLDIQTKPDLSPVTDADKSVEQALLEILATERSGDSILGEEFGETGNSSRKWIIDPIDGTANFIRGVPIWATLIALSLDDKPIVSVVSAPAMGLRWWASSEDGASYQGIDGQLKKLSVSNVQKLSDASISYNNLQLWQRSKYLNQLLELSNTVWRTRAYGDFWSYMLLAQGAIDMVCEHDLKIYDIAALVPIVENAGGTISDLAGALTTESSSVLATNTLLHSAALEHFSKAAN